MATSGRPWPSKLYTIHRFENDQTKMNLIFRDHTISDLIGFVYSGMPRRTPPTTSCATSGKPRNRFLMRDMMRWSRSSSMARMRGNTIPSRAANFCAASTMRCSTSPASRPQRCPKQSSGTAIFAAQVAGSGIVDSRQLQRLDRRSGRQPGLGLSLPCPQFLCPGRSRGQRSPAATGLRRNPDCRRQRLELVVWPRAPFRQRPRIRRTLPQAPLEYVSAARRPSA